jgi:hypothetical protein
MNYGARGYHTQLGGALLGSGKPLRGQAIGWNPDLNYGVRMNIRSFLKADILRKTPEIN